MDQSRLRKLRRKRLLFNATWYLLGIYLLGIGLFILAIYAEFPVFSLLFLSIAGVLIIDDILRRKFKVSNPMPLFSADMRELEEYEVTHLHKKQTELIKGGWITRYVIVVVMLWLAYLLRHHGILHHMRFDDIFSPFSLGYPIFFWFITLSNGMAEDYELDRVAGRQPLTQIEMDIDKVERARKVNGRFFGGTLLVLFTMLYPFLSDWLKSDAAFFLPGAVALLIPIITYLFTRRLNPYSFFIPRIREYTEWRKGELGDDWNWNQRVGFVASLLSFVTLLAYAYWNRGGHHWMFVDVWDMLPIICIVLFACWVGFRVIGLKLDHALLPEMEEEEEIEA